MSAIVLLDNYTKVKIFGRVSMIDTFLSISTLKMIHSILPFTPLGYPFPIVSYMVKVKSQHVHSFVLMNALCAVQQPLKVIHISQGRIKHMHQNTGMGYTFRTLDIFYTFFTTLPPAVSDVLVFGRTGVPYVQTNCVDFRFSAPRPKTTFPADNF